MRRLNIILIAGMFLTFLLHGITGALTISGGNSDVNKIAAWICVFFVALHVIVTTILTVKTLHAIHKTKAGYFKNNIMFWIRRISGFTILIPLLMHLFIFNVPPTDIYRLKAFDTGRFISQLLMVLTISLHVLTNIKPFMLAIGAKNYKKIIINTLFVLAILFLLFAVAFCIYYLRWNT